MTREAQAAVANAMRIVVKKHGINQRQSGEWTVCFSFAAREVPAAVMNADMGQRFVMALVQIDDNESPTELPETERQPPVDQAEEAKLTPKKPRSRTQMAGILCGDGGFHIFLEKKYPSLRTDVFDALGATDLLEDKTVAAQSVRMICDVKSRAELDKDSEAAALWDKLYGEWLLWKTGDFP